MNYKSLFNSVFKLIISRNEKTVLIAIVAANKGQDVILKNDYLVKESNLNLYAVKKAIEGLKEKGLITINKKGRLNEYKILFVNYGCG